MRNLGVNYNKIGVRTAQKFASLANPLLETMQKIMI